MYLKKTIALMLTLSIAFSFGACNTVEEKPATLVSTDEATNLLNSAREKMPLIESYSGGIDLEFKFTNNEGDLEAEVSTDVLLSDIGRMHIEIETVAEGTVLGNSEFYVDVVAGSDERGLYMFYDEQWFQSKSNVEELYYLLGHYDLPDITRIFLTASTGASVVGEETIDGKKVTRIDAIVGEDYIANTLIFTGVFVATGMGTITEEYFNGATAMPISFWIDEDNNVVKLAFDAGPAYQTISDNLFDVVKDLEGYEDAQKLVVNTYAFEMNMKNIGDKNSIEIPQLALDGELLDQ